MSLIEIVLYRGQVTGDWGEIVALEGSKSPWEALRVTKTSPSISATFKKANTCVLVQNELFVRRNPVKIEQTCKGKIVLKKSC